jgi:flotillin
VVVPTNEVHIVQTRKATHPYGKGFEKGAAYFKRPSWIPIIGIERIILPVSIFTIELENYKAYDIGKVPFVVDVKARFRVEEPKTAGQRISNFNELKSQLDDILRGAIRKILASSDVEEIMVGRGKFGGEFSTEVENQARAF